LIVSQQNSCSGISTDWKDAGGPEPDFCQTMSSLERDLEAQGSRSCSSFTMSMPADPRVGGNLDLRSRMQSCFAKASQDHPA
jgi:hypothetical protein